MSVNSSYSPTENSAQLIIQVEQYLDQGGGELVRRALELASVAHDGHRRMSGVPYLNHTVAVAEILASWLAPAEVIAAGLLHDVAKENYSNMPSDEEITAAAGAKVVQIVKQVARLGRLGPVYHAQEDNEDGGDDFAHLLPWATHVLQQEPLAIIVKIADRLDNFRTLDVLAADRAREFAQGTRNIFIPFAERLGMRQAKRALEDNAFRVLQAESYQYMAQTYATKACETALDRALVGLQEQFVRHGIEAEVRCAPYSYYELFRRQIQQAVGAKSKLPPILVLVEDPPACYQAMGIIHQIWRPRVGSIQDLIAVPKVNGYRALHTTVRNEDGEYSLVLIRDPEMHLVAEYGVTAAWRGVRKEVLPSLPAWKKPPPGMIAIFTPDGELIQLPEGACAVDFAYHIHPELGHHCSGAIVNGHHSALDAPLKTGDVVRILTSGASVGPSLEWLKLVKTPKARRAIKKWTEKRNPAEARMRGNSIIDSLLREHGATLSDPTLIKRLATVANGLGYVSTNELFIAVGVGQRSADDVVRYLIERKGNHRIQTSLNATIVSITAANYPHRLARCCRPRPPDPIVGYVTKNRRVSIHKADCHVIRHRHPLVAAEWKTSLHHQVTEIEVSAVDRPHLVADISTFISDLELNMTGFHADRIDDGSALLQIVFENVPPDHIEVLIEGLEQIPDVNRVNTTALRLPRRYASGAVVEQHFRNPYTLSPASGAHFFGRNQELQELLDLLRQIQPGEAVLMWGPRRIGKTSILLQFQESILSRDDYVVAYLNLQELGGRNTTVFLWKILQEIAGQLQQGNVSAPSYRRMKHAPLGYFDSFMENALSKAQKYVVLLIDEFQLLSTLEPLKVSLADINDYFRNLTQKRVGITIIFSGGGILADLRQQSGAVKLLEVSRYQKIGILGENDARALITEPVTRYTLDDEVAEHLIALTAGHPYFLQLLCSNLHTHAISLELPAVGMAELTTFLDDFLPKLGEQYFSHQWGEGMVVDSAKLLEYKLALVAVASSAGEDGWSEFEDIARTGAGDRLGDEGLWLALRNLAAMDTLVGDRNGGFRINIPLCQRWLQQNYRIEHVLWEMQA